MCVDCVGPQADILKLLAIFQLLEDVSMVHVIHWVPSRGRSESAALGVCVYIKSLYTHTLRVLTIHFGREAVPSACNIWRSVPPIGLV